MKVVAAGGGTGGHLFPLFSILEELEKRVDLEVLFFSVRGKIDDRLVRREHPSYRVVSLDVKGLRRPLRSPSNLWRLLKYVWAVLKVKRHLTSFKPDFAVLTGGYISAIVGMAIPRRVPIFIHEQNAIPGLANLFLSKRARKVFVSFEKSIGYFKTGNVVLTGNPVREIFYTKRRINVPDGVVLVLGGSLGSELINSVMERVYKIERETMFIHSTGDPSWTERLSRFENVFALNFIDFMPLVWRKARMVIARAGATTVAEMLRYGVGGILVPWRGSAEGHQIDNAKAIKNRIRVKIVDEGSFDEKVVIESLKLDWKVDESENPVGKLVAEILEEIG